MWGTEMRTLARVRLLTPLIGALLVSGCSYTFRPGSGFPEHIRTLAVVPFENDTERFELTQELHEQLLSELPQALGVRNAGEDRADAVVRGRIIGYTLTSPLFRPGDEPDRIEVLQRQVTIRIQVEIVDLVDNVILWEDQGLSVNGQYLDGSETEEVGREEAIELIVQRIVDGAQSNW